MKQPLPILIESIEAATNERPACVTCGLYAGCKSPFMRPFVPENWSGQLLVVGEGPGANEDKQGQPFVGAAGELLATLLREAGWKSSDVAFDNAVRCRPPDNATPKMSQLRACRPFLLHTITSLKPKHILGVGTSALKTLANLGSQANLTGARGRQIPIPGTERTAYVTFHPAAVLRGAVQYRDYILTDLKKLREEQLAVPDVGVPFGKVIGFDTEYSSTEELLTIGVGNNKSASSVERVIDGHLEAVRDCVVLAGHNIAVDLRQLGRLGEAKEEWIKGQQVLDTLLLARMVDENGGKGAYKLENLLAAEENVPGWKGAPRSKDATDWPLDYRMERCRLDAWATHRLASRYFKRLKHKLPLVRYTHRIASVLDRVALTGAWVALESFEKLKTEYHTEMERSRDLLVRRAAIEGITDFNPTNDGDIRSLLYDHLGLPILGRTKKKKEPSVDAITLKQLVEQGGSGADAVRDLLAYNKAQKVYSVNGVGLDALIHRASPNRGYLSFNINPLGARTGRRSSSHPNSQNWPAAARRTICSRFSGGSIGDFDYKSLEVILIAWVAGDERLLRAFTRGRGYLDVAKDLWGLEVEKGTPQYRATKSVVLGVNYNMQFKKMAKQLWEQVGVKFSADYGEHAAKTKAIRAQYLRQHRPLVGYMDARRREFLRTGRVVSLTGRERHLPLIDGDEDEAFGHSLNQAINYPIQSLASEITGSALIDIEYEFLREAGLTYKEYYELLIQHYDFFRYQRGKRPEFPPMSFIINEVHDSIVADLHPDTRIRDTEIIVETMRTVPSLHRLLKTLGKTFTAPLNVDISVGATWGLKG